jgi:hypothetical protein
MRLLLVDIIRFSNDALVQSSHALWYAYTIIDLFSKNEFFREISHQDVRCIESSIFSKTYQIEHLLKICKSNFSIDLGAYGV